MIKGKVKFYDRGRGFGFIAPDGLGKDIFVAQSQVAEAKFSWEGTQRVGLKYLNEGQSVEYSSRPGRDGQLAAENLVVSGVTKDQLVEIDPPREHVSELRHGFR